MKVIKRNNLIVEYDRIRIVNAIKSANNEVPDSEKATDDVIDLIVSNVEANFKSDSVSVEEIQDSIENLLMELGYYTLAKTYITYRYKRGIIRGKSTTDDAILGLIRAENKDILEENSNKDSIVLSTQRDLMAGEVSKDLTERVLLPKSIVKAEKSGIIHFHDADYFVQSMFNCCLINIKDMLENGTVINSETIDTPKSFRVACTVMTQIIAAVASSQYGGQSVNIKHLGKYAEVSYNKIKSKLNLSLSSLVDKFSTKEEFDEFISNTAMTNLRQEIKDGVQTIQYQLNSLMTTNGQSPFVTLFLELDDNDKYENYTAMIIEEIFKQRIVGIKNEFGVYTTPAFPKLIYVLDENNIFKGGKYDYLTELAVECSAKRMVPDYISAKKMREYYDGEVFSCMGCRSFLSEWKDENDNYKWEGRFNQGVVSINLPQIAILAKKDEDKFWNLLDERLDLCFEALMCRHKSLEGVLSDVSPIHWQYGAISRLKSGETIDKLLHNGYSTISLGYIGIYEMTLLMKEVSHTTTIGKNFALRVLKYLGDTCDKWKDKTGIGFGLYGTPAESLCYKFARKDAEIYGKLIPSDIYEDIVGKGYYTNSYHVDVREDITAFDKLEFESVFQDISSGGAISYVELPNIVNNIGAAKELVKFIYDNIKYAEINTRNDICHSCGFEGEIKTNKNDEWKCPQCHNKNQNKMTITRRTCGYIGSYYWNKGKTKEINSRKLHL